MNSNNLSAANISNDMIKNRIVENFKVNLLERIKNCGAGKKLRTYNLFKHMIMYEPYLDWIENTKLRKTYSKFRLSAHELEIEKGRYGVKSIPPEQRICKMCDQNMVEDEIHFLIACSRYAGERNTIFEDINKKYPSIKQLPPSEKFIWLMNHKDKSVTLTLAYFLKIANEIRTNELELQITSLKKQKQTKATTK